MPLSTVKKTLNGLVGSVWFMVFKATFNNISVISWQSVLLMEKTRVPRENHEHVASHGRRDRMVVGFTTTFAISAYHH
jgi:hypothetical protein